MNFENLQNKNLPESDIDSKDAVKMSELKSETSPVKKKSNKKAAALALGAFLSVSVPADIVKGSESGEGADTKNKIVESEKTGIESAVLRPILRKIMEDKLPDNAPTVEKNKRGRTAAVQLVMFIESQANKKAAVKTLQEALQDEDVQKDRELSDALRRTVGVYQNFLR